jgi:4-amino-4-deoxy-L-arabinose transferase-like glycosyltransferase
MFAFMGGAVNNDMGVNAAAAVTLFCLIRALRRGLSIKLAVGLGAATSIMPLLKGTGYALVPMVLIGLAGVLWRRQLPGTGRAVVVACACALVVMGLWSEVLAPGFDRGSFAVPGGGIPGEGTGPLANLQGYLSYLWQMVLPPLPFMTDLWQQPWPVFDIYVVRGFGAFGWYQVLFPHWVYVVLVAVMALVAAAGASLVVREWSAVKKRGFEVLVLAGWCFGMVAAVAAAYYTPTPRGEIVAEMGRYAFPAVSAFAALAVCAAFSVGRRYAVPAASALAVGMIALNSGGQLVALTGFFT